MSAGSNCTLGKIVGSGWKKTVVPVPRAGPAFFSGPDGLPRRNEPVPLDWAE